MVLILPEFNHRGREGSVISGLIAAIKSALNAQTSLETRNLTFRVLGNSVVIEGTVDLPGAADVVQSLAENLAGPGRIIVRVSCPRGQAG